MTECMGDANLEMPLFSCGAAKITVFQCLRHEGTLNLPFRDGRRHEIASRCLMLFSLCPLASMPEKGMEDSNGSTPGYADGSRFFSARPRF